jgi:hypothetical protein
MATRDGHEPVFGGALAQQEGAVHLCWLKSVFSKGHRVEMFVGRSVTRSECVGRTVTRTKLRGGGEERWTKP